MWTTESAWQLAQAFALLPKSVVGLAAYLVSAGDALADQDAQLRILDLLSQMGEVGPSDDIVRTACVRHTAGTEASEYAALPPAAKRELAAAMGFVSALAGLFARLQVATALNALPAAGDPSRPN
ncbi:hypothetical protein [Ramlibacter alkalitolerans]|uniref:Uncharacterized protein n=1 Tax=Ramlibacter alkalitolerans TaxID=2039631 RepID=A0ABS1JUG6_9BURK|nr:hypothetical protein [Ramlibacter alkalitolerans]MBL0427940.1 hypothetical protein [Ramlibacter alkalitolerans]